MDERTVIAAQERVRLAHESYARLQAEYEALLAQYNQKLVETKRRLPEAVRNRLAAHLCLIERLFSVVAVGTIVLHNCRVHDNCASNQPYEMLINTHPFEKDGSYFLRADVVIQSDDACVLAFLQYTLEQIGDDEPCKMCWIHDKTQGQTIRFHYETASL
jgi:hypothetical protein